MFVVAFILFYFAHDDSLGTTVNVHVTHPTSPHLIFISTNLIASEPSALL